MNNLDKTELITMIKVIKQHMNHNVSANSDRHRELSNISDKLESYLTIITR